MQSETAYFSPVMPPGEVDEMYVSSVILVHSLQSTMWKRDVINKTGIT